MKWSYENCKKEALKYKKRYEFRKNCQGGYDDCLNNGWLGDVCSHMIKRNVWNYENCRNKYLECGNLEVFKKNIYQDIEFL